MIDALIIGAFLIAGSLVILGAYTLGARDGHTSGHAEAWDAGRKEGFSKGWHDGYQLGRRAGMAFHTRATMDDHPTVLPTTRGGIIAMSTTDLDSLRMHSPEVFDGPEQ